MYSSLFFWSLPAGLQIELTKCNWNKKRIKKKKKKNEVSGKLSAEKGG
jgi:hypothetical protein